MKTLYVLRHGHAAPESEAETDHARVLTPRGVAEARHAAKHWAKRASEPRFILSSDAARARQTAELCKGHHPKAELRLLSSLYLAEPPEYLDAISGVDGAVASVLVVGHNPGLEALVYALCQCSEHLATASLVEIELNATGWADAARARAGAARVIDVFRP
jgi:phosphohistidine phosphatase